MSVVFPGLAGVAVPRLAVLLVSAAGVLVVLVRLARFCLQQLRMYRMTRHLPGPWPTLPLIGNCLDLFIVQHEDIMGYMMDMKERFGPTYRVWLGPFLVIFCFEPEDLQAIYSHPHLQTKGSVYNVVPSFIGNGFITHGSSNPRHRKAFTPSLHLDILKSFIPAFALQGRNLNEAMKHLSHSGETFNVLHLTERAVSQAACDTMLGSVRKDLVDRMGDDVRVGAKHIMYVIMRPWLGRSDLCFRLLAPAVFKERQRVHKMLDGLVRRAVVLKEEQLREQEQLHGEQQLSGQKQLQGEKQEKKEPRVRTQLWEEWTAESDGAKELVEHVLTSKEGALIDRDELVDDLIHLLAGGIVTSSDLLALLMLALALNPDAQDKVHQELDEVFADDPSRPVTAEDMPKLRYLEMAIKEVMRYFPLIPIYGRNATDDITLPSGTVVPRNSMVGIITKAVHWDPRWYPDPSVFDPDRHKPEVAKTRPSFSYIPFSGGSRGCIGQRYGTLLSKTIAATVLREYRFLPAPGGVQRLCDLKVVLGIAMHVKGGVNVCVERRDNPS